jgi:peptidyl-prolyl cis-trans isomerase B (cyclophilin B)
LAATKKERQRQLAREAYERRMDRQVRRTKRMRQLGVISVVAVIVIAVGVGSAAIAGVFTPAKPLTCSYVASGTASRSVSLPPKQPDVSATYTAKITTNRGVIKINLQNSQAPCTVNSFVSLAKQNFFTKTPCHRLTTSGIFVLQCGDPTGTGEGGPGYKFDDENLKGAKYPAGTMAMANSGPNTNGSQFFLVYKNTPLGASYTPFGTITSGLKVLQAIAKVGSDNSNGAGDGHPKESVQIESVTISKA